MFNVDPPTIAGDAVYASCFQAKIVLDGAKETGDLHRRKPTVLIYSDSTLLVQLKPGPAKDKKATDVGIPLYDIQRK